MKNSEKFAAEERWFKVKNYLKFETWTEFAEFLNSNDNRIRSYRKNIAEIPRELEKKLREHNINVDWLIYGTGDMLISESKTVEYNIGNSEALAAQEDTPEYHVTIYPPQSPRPLVAGEIPTPQESRKILKMRRIVGNDSLSFYEMRLLLLDLLQDTK